MRAFRLAIAALALCLALGACSEKSGALAPVKTDAAAVEKFVENLSTESFKGKATAATDIALARDALPGVALTWSALTFDAASGATVLTGVKLTPADAPAVGLSAEEVRLWDFDADFAKARLAGQRLTETASLARRIEAKGVSVFGLETLFPKSVETTAPTADQAFASVEDIIRDVNVAAVPTLDGYKVSIGRLILDDVMLRPYELAPVKLEPGDQMAEFLPVAQTWAAMSRAFAVNAAAMFDMKIALAMTDRGERVAIDMDAKTVGARGWRGGDTDATFARTVSFKADIPAEAGGPTQSIEASVDFYSIEGTRLDKLYSYLAKGQWPPRTDTNLLSIGLFTARNTSTKIGGFDLYSSAEETVDLRDFYWFVPTKLKASARDVVYNVDGFLNYVASADPSLTADPDSARTLAEARDIIARNGFEKVSYDSTFAWDWNPQTGAAKIGGNLALKDYMTFDLAYEGGFPSFKAISDLVPDDIESTDQEAVSKAFADLSTLKSLRIDVADKGGLEKTYAMIADFAKLAGASAGTGGNVAGNLTPQGVRQMAVAGVYMAADQGSPQVPQLRDMLAPVAEFLDKGGKLKITLNPRRPMVYATAGQSVMTGSSSPAGLLSELNAKVVHTAPAGAK